MPDYTRDLWWEARQKTYNASQPGVFEKLTKWVTLSLPGQPTRTVFSALGLERDRACLAIDLNLYRPDRNLKAYYEAGADLFILRIGGPSYWVQGDWRYKQDVTYRPYLEQLDRLGLLHRSIGYIIHNPFESYTQNGATGETLHTELIDDWTSGGYMPGAFVYDHEVAKCWRAGAEITCTNYNLVKSLDVNTDNTWKKFKRRVGIYTARWFTNTYGPTEHTVYFDNINRPGVEMRPMWWAWYPQNMSAQYTDLQQSLNDLIVPTQDQYAKLLNIGSYSLGALWQFTDRLKLSPDAQGVDASVSLGSLEDCLEAFGLPVTPAEPPAPPEPPTEPGNDDDIVFLKTRTEALEARLTALEGKFTAHAHTTGAPNA